MNNPDILRFVFVILWIFFSLTQVVTKWTHSSQSGNSSLIDLALVSSPPQSVTCTTIPPLANSDLNGLKLTASHKTIAQHLHTKRQTVWQYAHADFFRRPINWFHEWIVTRYTVKILNNIAYSGKTCTCRSWNSASQKCWIQMS